MGNVYEDDHFVSIQPSGSKSDGRSLVHITIQWNAVKGLPKKELFVRISEEHEFSFLCTLRLNEDGFQQLKSQQGVLVDFPAFSERLVDLLRSCKKEENEDTPRFVLRFVASEENNHPLWTLHIVETNSFKHLTHLALKFFPANDKEVRDYLTLCLKQVKEESARVKHALDSSNNNLSLRLNETQQKLAEKSLELDRVSLELRAKEAEIVAQFQQQLSSQVSKTQETKATYEHRLAEERQELELTYSTRIKTLTAQLQESEALSKALSQENRRLETQLRDVRRSLETCEESLQSSRQEVGHLKRQVEDLDAQRHELDTTSHRQATRIAVLEQEAADKATLATKVQEMLTSEQEQRKHFQDEAEQKSRQIDLLDRSVQNYTSELTKGNAIIKKLQDEIVAYHNKVKIRNQIVTEQEKAVESKEKEMDALREEFKSLKVIMSSKDEEVESLREKLESLNKRYNECKQEVKSHENVIAWLNRQLTEQQGQRLNGPSVPSLSSTATASVMYRPHSSAAAPFMPPSTMASAPSSYPAPGKPPSTMGLTSSPPSTVAMSNGSAGATGTGLDLKYLRPTNTGYAMGGSRAAPLQAGDTSLNPQEQSLTSAYFPKALQNITKRNG